MKRRLAAAFTLVFIVAALAYSRPENSTSSGLKIDVEEKNPWTHLGLQNRPENFQFAIVTDRTGGPRPGIFESAVDKLNHMQPEFVMSVGDLIQGASEPDAIAEQWREFNGFVKRLDMPFFYVPGNHDINNANSIPLWQSQFGRTYFHFVYHDVLFVCLNTEDPPPSSKVDNKLGRFSDAQLAWLRKTLDDNRNVRWTIVFLHKPMWQAGPLTNWDRVESALGDRPRTVFAGHHHRFLATKVGKYTYYALATTGGASKLAGVAEGSFDHFVWVTMTPDGPKMANLMLDGVWSDDPVAEAKALREAAAPAPEPAPSAKVPAAAKP
jgi:predicted phosphodiesterase